MLTLGLYFRRMKQSMTAFLAIALLIFITTPASAADPPTDQQAQAQLAAGADAKSKALLEKLTPEDREAIAKFLQETEDVKIFRPDIIAYLVQRRRYAAIKIVVDAYHLDARRAGIVVDLIGYANGLE